MTSFEIAPKIAVIGAHGIGKFHAGLFNHLGADVKAICCSSPETAKQCSEDLQRDFGITATPYYRIEDVLALDLDGVSLCTPPHMHYEQLLACLDQGLPVFCEKPLFWDEADTMDEVVSKLSVLSDHPQRRIFVNTSNTHFLDVARTTIGTNVLPPSLKFSFYTRGPYTESSIAFDLFPHAISYILNLYGERKITDFTVQVETQRYTCSFCYGDAHVSFDLREDPDGPKRLFFVLDGRRFNRVQEGYGSTYRVFLEDAQTNSRIETDDPFKIFISDFIRYVRSGAPVCHDSFIINATNLKLMSALLLENSL